MCRSGRGQPSRKPLLFAGFLHGCYVLKTAYKIAAPPVRTVARGGFPLKLKRFCGQRRSGGSGTARLADDDGPGRDGKAQPDGGRRGWPLYAGAVTIRKHLSRKPARRLENHVGQPTMKFGTAVRHALGRCL